MKVSHQINTAKTPAFKSTYLIKIAKNLFPEPDNLERVALFFSDTLEDTINESNAIPNIPSIYRKFFKTFSFLEQPLYINMLEELKEEKVSSLAWLSQNIGLKIKNPINEHFHSFYVYTKEHKDLCMLACARGRINKILSGLKKELTDLQSQNKKGSQNSAWLAAFANDILFRDVRKINKCTKIKQRTVRTLSGLNKTLKEIDY